jgi:molybdopterin synthase sulfur carrier subunit
MLATDDELQRIGQHGDVALSHSYSLGDRLVTHIDHVGLTGIVEMGQFGRVFIHVFCPRVFKNIAPETQYTVYHIVTAENDTMSITVKFFASLRETLDKANVSLNADDVSTVADVWNAATDNHEPISNMLVAVNMEYAKLDDTVKDGDEVAFFPPVTGG